MKTLAIFAEKLYGGGVEKILQTYLINIKNENYSLSLYSLKKEILLDGIYPQTINHYYFFETLNEDDSFLRRLKKLITNRFRLFVYYHFCPAVFYNLFVKNKPDIAVAFIEGYATRIVSGAPHGIKTIAWVHTDLVNNHWTTVAFRNAKEERACYLKFDKIVCVSQCIQNVMISSYHLDSNTVILHNPIDRIAILEASRQLLPDEYKRKTRLRVVSIGSLIPIKGYDRLLRCVSRLQHDGFDFELYLVGDGNMKETLCSFVKQNGLIGSVIFTGFLDNPYNLLASSDLYVCSSFAEGLNTAITEALILGLPIVSTLCSGTIELLGESQYGLVVSNDEEGLYNGLRCLLVNPDLRQRFALSAQERGYGFSVEKPLKAFYELLN